MAKKSLPSKTNHWLWFTSSALAIGVYFAPLLSPINSQVLGQTNTLPLVETQTLECIIPGFCQLEVEHLTGLFPSYKDGYIYLAYYNWLDQNYSQAQFNLEQAQKLDPLNPYLEILQTIIQP